MRDHADSAGGDADTPTDGLPAASLSVERVKPSYVQVAAQLRSLILGGELAQGQRLPVEGDLAAMFGVSRSTTREALRLLTAENLVETRRGVSGGTFVIYPEPEDIEVTLATALTLSAASGGLSRTEIVELWQITQIPAAALAAQRRSDEHVADLMRLSEPDTDHLSLAELALQTLEFHHVLLDATGNRLLGLLTRPLATASQQLIEEGAVGRDEQEAANARHRPIAEAIAARDADLASKLVEADLVVAPVLNEPDPQQSA